MKNIVKRYKATLGDGREIIYEIIARKDGYTILYYGYIIHQKKNDATPQENFDIAKELLFSQTDRTFIEVDPWAKS